MDSLSFSFPWSLLDLVKKSSVDRHVCGVLVNADISIDCEVDISRADGRITIHLNVVTGQSGSSILHTEGSAGSVHLASIQQPIPLSSQTTSPRRSARKRKIKRFRGDNDSEEAPEEKKTVQNSLKREKMSSSCEDEEKVVEAETTHKAGDVKEEVKGLVVESCTESMQDVEGEVLAELQRKIQEAVEEESEDIVGHVEEANQEELEEETVSKENEMESEECKIEMKPILHYSRHHISIPSHLKHRCGVCSKAFLLESSLHSHVRRMHHMTIASYQAAVVTGSFPSNVANRDAKVYKPKPRNTGIKAGGGGEDTPKLGRKRGSKCRGPSLDPSVELHECVACRKMYMTVRTLWMHMETHAKEKDYNQYVMDTEYNMAKRRASQAIEIQCTLCKQKCFGNQVLVHLKKWHSEHEQCVQHMEKLKTQLLQDREQKMFAKNPHLKAKVTCHLCGKQIPQRVLSNHIKRHCHQNPDRVRALHRCKVCYTALLSEDMLNEHMLNKHPPDSHYQCETCGNDYSRLSSLIIHRRKVHGFAKRGEKDYPCPICGKKFAYPYDLKNHSLVHTDKKEVPCDICGKLFKSKNHVRDHIRTLHLNRYAYHCQLCGHGVQKKRYLKTHVCSRVRRKQATETVPAETVVTEDVVTENEAMKSGDVMVTVISDREQVLGMKGNVMTIDTDGLVRQEIVDYSSGQVYIAMGQPQQQTGNNTVIQEVGVQEQSEQEHYILPQMTDTITTSVRTCQPGQQQQQQQQQQQYHHHHLATTDTDSPHKLQHQQQQIPQGEGQPMTEQQQQNGALWEGNIPGGGFVEQPQQNMWAWNQTAPPTTST